MDLAEIKLDFTGGQGKHWSAISAAETLLGSDEPVYWWETPRLSAGDWIQFEELLAYDRIALGGGAKGSDPTRVAIFWKPTRTREKVLVNPPYLLLHGSAQFMNDEINTENLQSDWTRSGSIPSVGIALLAEYEKLDPSLLPNSDKRRLTSALSSLVKSHFYPSIIPTFPSDIAIPMVGFARVTARIKNVVVASPLYVVIDRTDHSGEALDA